MSKKELKYKTYIIRSGIYYKIGKTTSIERRLEDYNIHNPDYELIELLDFDCETYLHMRFEDRHYKSAWYILDYSDIQWVTNNHETLRNNTHSILNQRRIEQKQREAEEKRRIRNEKKKITREKKIMKMQLEDKEVEEWLLKRIGECPECFSN